MSLANQQLSCQIHIWIIKYAWYASTTKYLESEEQPAVLFNFLCHLCITFRIYMFDVSFSEILSTSLQ